MSEIVYNVHTNRRTNEVGKAPASPNGSLKTGTVPKLTMKKLNCNYIGLGGLGLGRPEAGGGLRDFRAEQMVSNSYPKVAAPEVPPPSI